MKLTRNPVTRMAAGLVPGLGTAMTVAGVAGGTFSAVKALGGGNKAGLPALPSGAGLPMLPGMGNAPATMGQRGIFQNDPNIIEGLQGFAISKANLKTAFRAPKGFVVVRDSNGDPFALPKALAKKFFGYRQAKKPPISVGEWQAVKKADRTVKKVRKVMATMVRVDKAVAGGKIKIRKGKSK